MKIQTDKKVHHNITFARTPSEEIKRALLAEGFVTIMDTERLMLLEKGPIHGFTERLTLTPTRIRAEHEFESPHMRATGEAGMSWEDIKKRASRSVESAGYLRRNARAACFGDIRAKSREAAASVKNTE